MTTYNSYEEAKIANPEKTIYKIGDNFTESSELLGQSLQPCNPADHCMTVEKFLADGHKFVDGDAYLDRAGDIEIVGKLLSASVVNEKGPGDKDRFILRAAALEEKSSEKVEWVNGDECAFDDRTGIFIGLSKNKRLAIVEIDNEAINHDIDLVKVCDLKKPETKQQREDRERLENGKALYELVQKIWCDVDSKYTALPYESGMVGDNAKEMYARLAIETSYRKDGK